MIKKLVSRINNIFCEQMLKIQENQKFTVSELY